MLMFMILKFNLQLEANNDSSDTPTLCAREHYESWGVFPHTVKV